MIIVLAFILMVLLFMRQWRIIKQKKHITAGQRRMMKARKRGDVTTARLKRCNSYLGTGEGIAAQNQKHCIYKYTVDGKEYTFKIIESSVCGGKRQIEICYDRTRGNRRIDPNSKDLGDWLFMTMPLLAPALLVIVYILIR